MARDNRMLIRLVYEAINVEDLTQWIHSEAAGAVVVFHGRVRNHSNGKRVIALEYEAYETMAEAMLRQLAEDAQGRWHTQRVAIVHRLGAVPIGEDAVVIAVASAHRSEAFSACEELIDRLKDVVPIWKRETTEEGSHWVGESRLFIGEEGRRT